MTMMIFMMIMIMTTKMKKLLIAHAHFY